MASPGQALDGLKALGQKQRSTRPPISSKAPLKSLRSVRSLGNDLGMLLTHLSAEDVTNASPSRSDVSSLRLIARSPRKGSQMTSSYQGPTQIQRSIHPIQIAQTEDNGLVLEGVGVIETLVGSEISSNVVTFTAFKTILLTTVSTSMICTCDNTASLRELTFVTQYRTG